MSEREQAQDRVARQLRERLETAALAERLIHLLSERGLTLAVAESDTGGLVTHLLTEVPGVSRCFLGGIVAYADSAKTHLLGVPASTLQQAGAASAETASAMAAGVRERFGADIGLGLTGIAGPSGGSELKPVGLVHIAALGPDGRSLQVREVWPAGSRSDNKRRSAARALALVEELVASLVA